MRDDSLRGVIPYLVSPFDPQGQLLEESLRQLVRDLLDAGVHGITPLGSTGEFAYLTFDQRLILVQTVIDEVAGSVPVLPGVAAASTYDAVAQAQIGQGIGDVFGHDHANIRIQKGVRVDGFFHALGQIEWLNAVGGFDQSVVFEPDGIGHACRPALVAAFKIQAVDEEHVGIR